MNDVFDVCTTKIELAKYLGFLCEVNGIAKQGSSRDLFKKCHMRKKYYCLGQSRSIRSGVPGNSSTV
jgi:hypothetical protein